MDEKSLLERIAKLEQRMEVLEHKNVKKGTLSRLPPELSGRNFSPVKAAQYIHSLKDNKEDEPISDINLEDIRSVCWGR